MLSERNATKKCRQWYECEKSLVVSHEVEAAQEQGKLQIARLTHPLPQPHCKQGADTACANGRHGGYASHRSLLLTSCCRTNRMRYFLFLVSILNLLGKALHIQCNTECHVMAVTSSLQGPHLSQSLALNVLASSLAWMMEFRRPMAYSGIN